MTPLDVFRPEVLAVIAGAFGLIIGSFLNVVIHRLPRGESLVHPRSRCPKCGHAIAAWENVPVFSYLALRGRCRACRARISPRYPAVELVTGLVFAAVTLRYGASPMTPVWCVFAAALIAAAVIDFDHRIIPDEISLGGLVVALVVVPLVSGMAGTGLGPAFRHSIAGAVLGGGVLWTIGFAHARISTALGREFEHWPGEGEEHPRPGSVDYWVWFPGLGFGDVKLLAMIGAAMGPVSVVETILVAAVAGLVGGIAWALAVRSWTAPFGFGPAIALAALLVLLVPHSLLFVH
jgi:leader peptidase (prepilin peptidase)/N-methyltransferase